MWSDAPKSDNAARAFAPPLTAAAAALIALALAWCLAPVAHAADLTAGQPPDGTTWSDFRGSPTNNAVTDAATPRTPDEAGLVWTLKLDGGYMSPCILVDDALVVTCGGSLGGTIYKLDKDTGEVLNKRAMSGTSTFSLIPPTYGDGKIFVTLSGGGMQAFDASSLDPLWVHRDELGGQGNCMITYSDGYVYTGYWGSETAEASFVCLDAQTGELVWKQQNTGGYYWVGAVVVGDYIVFGCDDGESKETGTSYVRCFEKTTGEEVSSVEVSGDQRSSIVYDPDLGQLYFTSKPGYLYSAEIDAETGALSNCMSLQVDAECVSTPLVYDGRVYVGASGGGFANGSLSVVDASDLSLLYQLNSSSGIAASVKSAPLVSTAYRDGDTGGQLYLYFTCNYPPGSVTALEVAPDSTEASQARVFELFKPPDALQQYCISSVICDNAGRLYYRNDSNYLMCIGPEGTPPADYVVPTDPEQNPPDPSPSDDSKQSGNAADPESENAEGGSGQGSSSGSGTSQQGSTSGNATATSQGGGSITTTSAASSSQTTTTTSTNTASSAAAASSSSSAAASASVVTGGTSASDSKRHTDAEASTQRLETTDSQGTQQGLPVPAIVIMGLAAAGLLTLVIVRVVSARKQPAAGVEADAPAPDSAGEDGSAHAR